jgi:hypothetical protein
MYRRNRLFIRVPPLFEAAAEGPFAIAALLCVAFALIGH